MVSDAGDDDVGGDEELHVVEVVLRGSAVTRWVPDAESGEAVVLEQSDWGVEGVEEVRCSCGRRFETEEAAVAHLRGVAVLSAFAPPYPVLVDVFDPGVGEEASAVFGVERFAGDVEEGWTSGELVEAVRERVETGEWQYDTVCYRPVSEASGQRGGGSMVLEPGTEMVRVPDEAVVGEVVPSGRPVRVTVARFAPYVFVDAPSD